MHAKIQRAFVVSLIWLAVGGIGRAALLEFGSGGAGGSGDWDTATVNWFNGLTDQAWSNGGNTAQFGGTAGTVTMTEAIQTDSVTFTVGGYEIASSGGGSLDDDGGTLSLVAPSGSGTTTTISGTIGGTGAWEWSYDAANTPFTGTLNLTGANTRSGDLTLNSPTNDKTNSRTVVRFNSVSALGDTSNTVIVNSKTHLAAEADLTLAHTVSFSGGTLTATTGNTITIDDASLLSGVVRAFGGNVSGGTIEMTDVLGAPTSGTTEIQSGITLDVANAAALGDSNTKVEWEGGSGSQRLLVSGTSTYEGDFIAERLSGNNESHLEVASGVTFTLTGDLNQQGGGNSNGRRPIFVKKGDGIFVLERAGGSTMPVETGTGGVRVDAGTLVVANTSGSATGNGYTRIMTGATLNSRTGSVIDPNNSTGTDDDAVAIFGGTLAPGESIGDLTIGNSTDLDDVLTIGGNDGTTDYGGTLEIELDGATSDFVEVYGTLILDQGLDSVLRLENFGSGATADFEYVIASYDTLQGTFDQIVNHTGLSLDTTFGTGGIDYDYLGNSDIAVRLTATVIPEPGAVGFLVLALSGLALRRRRR